MTSDELNEIMKNWQNLTPSRSNEEASRRRLVDKLRRNRGDVLTQRLRRRFRILIFCCISIIFFGIGMPRTFHASHMLQVSYTVFGIIELALTVYGYRRLCHLYYLDLPCTAAASRVRDFRRMYSRIRIISICLGLPVIALFLYELYCIDPFLFWSGLTGGIIGATIGLCIEIKNTRDINALLSTFTDAAVIPSDDSDDPDEILSDI